MRLLLFVNLIAVVMLAGALGRMYQGTPLPWRISFGAPAGSAPEAPASAASASSAAPEEKLPNAPVTPEPNPLRAVAAPAAAPAPSRPKLRILTEGAYPPFNYRDDEGRLAGFDIDVAHEVCARLKRECHIEARRWDELLPSLKRGEASAVVASVLIPSPGRETAPATDGVIFTQRYYSTPGHFVARKSDAAAAGALGVAGKRIAVQAGSAHEAFLKGRFSSAAVVALPTLDAAEAALADRSADLLFADRNAVLRWTRGGGGAECCRLVGVDYSDQGYFGLGAGIALRAGDEALRDEIDAALSSMAEDGTSAQIGARYFGQSIR